MRETVRRIPKYILSGEKWEDTKTGDSEKDTKGELLHYAVFLQEDAGVFLRQIMTKALGKKLWEEHCTARMANPNCQYHFTWTKATNEDWRPHGFRWREWGAQDWETEFSRASMSTTLQLPKGMTIPPLPIQKPWTIARLMDLDKSEEESWNIHPHNQYVQDGMPPGMDRQQQHLPKRYPPDNPYRRLEAKFTRGEELGGNRRIKREYKTTGPSRTQRWTTANWHHENKGPRGLPKEHIHQQQGS